MSEVRAAPVPFAPSLGERVRRGLALGVLAGLGLALLEVAFVVIARPLSFDSAGERVRFALCLLGLHLGAGALLGLLGGLLVHGVSRVAARRGDWEAWEPRLWTLLAAPPVIAGLLRLLAGRRVRELPAHSVLIALVIALSLAALYIALVAAHRLAAEPRPRVRIATGIAALVLTLLCHLADERVLPRLYPAFHLGLGAIQLLLLLLGGAVWLQRTPVPAGWRAVLLAVLALWSGRWSLRQLSFWPALRAVAFEDTTTAREILSAALALHVAPRAVTPPAHLPPRPAPVTETLPRGPRDPDADVFLITVDALRADRLDARTAPLLSALADTGARFDHAYSPVPHTSFAVTSLLTGKYVYSLAAIGESLDGHETLADLFKRERYKTAAFFPPAVFFIDHDRFVGLERTAFDFEYVKYEYMPAPGRTDQVIRFLDGEKPERVFAWIHYFDPHEPYDLHPRRAGGPAIDESSTALERYDGEVGFVDAEVARLIDYLRSSRPSAIIAFTADHGEEFGEHGGRYHGTTLYEEQLRVPLFIVGPNIAARRIAAPVSLLDVAPTLLALVDVMAPVKMRGHDLSPWMGAAAAPEDRLPPVFAEISAKKMIAEKEQRLICDVSRDFCELYDLAADPGELHNLAGREPGRVAPLRAELDDWMGGHATFERDPAGGERERAERALERCRLGDRSAAPEVARLLGAPDPQLADRAARALLRLPDDPAIHDALFAAQRSRPHDVLLSALALRAGDRALADPLARLSAGRAAAEADDLSPTVLGEVALALFAIGHPAAVPRLRAALLVVDDEDLERRLLAALGASRDRSALPALLAHLARSVRTRFDTVHAIGELHDRRAIGPLLEGMPHERYVTARAEMVRVVGQLATRDDPRVVPLLTRMLQSEPEPTVLDQLHLALTRLGAHVTAPTPTKK